METSRRLGQRIGLGLFTAGLLLVSCPKAAPAGAQSPPPARPASTPAKAKTTSALVSEDPKAQYLHIKKVFWETPAGTQGTVVPHQSAEDPNVMVYDIFSCTEGSELMRVAKDDPVAPLLNLAYDVVYFSRALEASGYPKSVWGPLIQQFEDQHLLLQIFAMGKLKDNYQSLWKSDSGKILMNARLVQELKSYREKSAHNLPKVIYEGECGAGEISIKIALTPRNGRVIFIPVFFYKLCKAQSLDPDNQTQCTRWREAAGGVLYASGDYFYRASWPDGTSRQGRLSFKGLQPGQTVTLSR